MIKIKSIISEKPIIIVLLSLFLIYIFVGFFGYGTDWDSFYLLRSGRNMLQTGIYHYSRVPGYFVSEIIMGSASFIGNYILTNLISSILATTSLYLFWRLLKNNFSDFNALLTIIIVGLNPYFIIAASSTIDYVYSLFFGLMGITLLNSRRPFFAAVLFALAVSSRLSSVIIIGIIYLYFIFIRQKEKDAKDIFRLLMSGVLLGCLAVLLYVPSFIAADYSFKFLKYTYIDNMSFFGYLSRFVYKNIYLIGLLPTIFLVGFTTWKLFKNKIDTVFNPHIITGLAIVIVSEILFFKIPCEISYLLPLLFIIIPLFISFLQPRKIILYTLTLFTISYGFVVNPDILNLKLNNTTHEVIGADIGIYMRRSVIHNNIIERQELNEESFCTFDKPNQDLKK